MIYVCNTVADISNPVEGMMAYEKTNDLIKVCIVGGATPTWLPEAWIAPTLENSWVNYGGADAIAGYYKDPVGMVHLRGLVKNGVTTLYTIIFTLPSGYRPAYNERFAAMSNDLFGNVTVGSDGYVRFITGSNISFSLNGITFRAA